MCTISGHNCDAFNSEKFKQVLHYIISETGSFPNVGKKSLYILLYFNDFNYYRLKRVRMTGEIYSKLEHSIVPKHFGIVINKLEKDGDISETKEEYYRYKQIKYRSLTEPDLTLLSIDEIKHIDETLGWYGSMNGSQIEEVSRRDIPWIASHDNEDLDYELVFSQSRDAFNSEKFKQVLHYIISKTGHLPNVGKKSLYKLLYFNDFNYYELNEVKMTGEIYSRLEHGPAPKHFDIVINKLEKDGDISVTKEEYYKHKQIKFRSLTEPDLTFLSIDEIKHIDETLRRYGSMNGSQIEDVSHKDIPWIASHDNEDLDYELVFYRSAEMSVREYHYND